MWAVFIQACHAFMCREVLGCNFVVQLIHVEGWIAAGTGRVSEGRVPGYTRIWPSSFEEVSIP
jgi:hypothetical protein